MSVRLRLLVLLALFVTVVGVGYAFAATSSSADAAVMGPGLVTVEVDIRYSEFGFDDLKVREGTTVQFVVINRDPINHEFVVGDAAVHARHERGSERAHPPVPGEVSVGALDTGITFYEFETAGEYRYACHLPGHVEYGMEGTITVVSA